MMTKFMNKQRGLLAAIMALVMVFAGAAFVAAEVDAAGTATVVEGPLDFEVVPNDLGNDLDVTYVSNENGGTYTLTGVLKKQDNSEKTSEFYNLWKNNTTHMYGIVFNATVAEGDKIQVGNGAEKTISTNPEQCLLYLSENDHPAIKTVKITSKGETKTYTLDLKGIVYQSGTEENPVNAVYTAEAFNTAVTSKCATINVMNDITVGAFTLGGNLTINTNNGKLIVSVTSDIGTDDTDLIAINVGTHIFTVEGDKGLDVIVTGKGKGAPGLYDNEIDTFGIAGTMGTTGATINLDAPTTITVNVTGKVADNKFACGVYGTTVTIGADVTISAGNRAVYANSLTVDENKRLTSSAFEKAIVINGGITVYGTIDASLLTTKDGVNGAGTDERHGIKTGLMTVDETGIVNTESIRLTNSGAGTISGTLNVLDSDVAGRVGTTDKPVVIPAGLIIADKNDNYDAKKDKALKDLGTLKISGKGTINLEAGCEILGMIAVTEVKDANNNVIVSTGNVTFGTEGKVENVEGEETLKVTQAIPIIAGSDMTISVGSVAINGIATSPDANGVIKISGNVTLSGTIDKGVTVESTDNSTITVTADGLVVNGTLNLTTGTNTIKAVGDVSGNGNITAGASLNVSKSPTSSFNITLPNGIKADVEDNSKIVTSFETLVKAIDSKEYNVIVLDENIDYNVAGIKELTIPAYVTLYLNGKTIEVKSGESLEVNGAHIYAGNPAGTAVDGSERIILKANANLYLDGADIRAPVDKNKDAYVSIKNALKMTVDGDATADLGVGYGNTLVLSKLTVPAGKAITAFGKVVIEGDVVISKNASVQVYKGGSVDVNGNLTIAGKADVRGTMTVKGTVKVNNTDGGAMFNVLGEKDVDYFGGSITVDSDAIFDVTKARSNGASENKLTINTGASFTVKGTLKVTGTLEGKVNDKGTIEFNGKSVDSTIVIYDGVTLNLASVTGHMTVTDEGNVSKTSLTMPYFIQDGNTVEIWNVKGLTITETVNESIKNGIYNNEDDRVNVFSTSMAVSGSVSAVDVTGDKKVEITAAGQSDLNYWETEKKVKVDYIYSTVSVGDVVVGEDIIFDVKGDKLTVSGIVSVLADNSWITTSSGIVTISGSIVIGPDSASKDNVDLNVNGMVYTMTDATTLDKTVYYTSFDAAIAAIDTVDEKTITVLGSITAEGAPTVPAGTKVIVGDGASLSIDEEAIMTVEATALLDASEGKVSVSGSLVIMDKESGLDANNGKDMFIYQVYTENGDAATYSGLAIALANAVSGDVITLRQNATIGSSTTIADGVTLVIPGNTELKIGSSKKDVTLTVNGVLDIQRNASVVEYGSAYHCCIVVNGVVNDAQGISGFGNTFEMKDYVTFNMKVDGKHILVYSNLTYAAENVSSGDVTVFGNVTAGDITFNSDDAALRIVFNDATGAFGTISVGTMTLAGEEGVTLPAGDGTITGTIASAAGSIDLSATNGITISSGIVEDVEGTTDYLYVNGTLNGKMVVSTGTVTMNEDLIVGTDKDDILTIASDATLATGAYDLTVEDAAISASVKQYAALIVDGTLSVVKGKIIVNVDSDPAGNNYANGKVIINGTLSIAESETSAINGEMVVLGQLAINDTEEKAASLTVAGKLEIGAVPSLGANASVSGPIAINGADASVIVYEGADVSAAIIDPKADDTTGAKYTDIKVNGTEFMTVYVDKDNTSAVTLQSTLPDIEGYDVAKADWTANGSKITGTTVTVGTYEMAEATLPASKIGLTVSAGVGLKVYIDGLSVDAYYTIYGDDTQKAYWISLGTHTVSIGVESGYDGSAATITVNGVAVSNNGTFTVDVDDKDVVIIASGAVPAQSGSTVVVDDADDGMALTDILLIVLVVLIVIMAIIVALRMMRS